MKLLGRGKRASVRLLGSLVGVMLIVGITAGPAAADHQVDSVSPNNNVPIGCEVTITGSDFDAVSAVTIGGMAAVHQVISTTQIAAVVPSGAGPGSAPIVVTEAVGDTDSVAFDTVSTACPVSVTNLNPTTGVVGTSVVITGTGFVAPVTVRFNQTTATGVVVNSSTQITATVPTGATTGPVRVTSGGNTARSSGTFTVVTPPAPTITSFAPAFGPTGKSVTITGTNFMGTISGVNFTTTGVTFNNVTATFTVNSATQITATVPSTATTGRIRVTNGGGTATSATDFTVSKTHSRSVTLKLKKHVVASGVVNVGDGFTACEASVPVKIQRKGGGGGWKNVGSTTTSASGSYKKKVKDKDGKYRARVAKVVLNNGVDLCLKATSPVRKHND